MTSGAIFFLVIGVLIGLDFSLYCVYQFKRRKARKREGKISDRITKKL